MTSLKDRFATVRPREDAGTRTSNRYDYQVNWSILLLLKMLQSNSQFVLVMDYYDDVILVDTLNDPKFARFHQVKTKTPGNWTITQLSRACGHAEPRSIISRMYDNLNLFRGCDVRCYFISNASFRVKDVGGKTLTFEHFDFGHSPAHSDEQNSLTQAVLNDFAPPLAADWLEKVKLETSTLGINSQAATVQGEMLKFFSGQEVLASHITSIYEALYLTLRAKVGFEQRFNDFLAQMEEKCLDRAEVEKMLARAATRPQTAMTEWSSIELDLQQTGMSLMDRLKHKRLGLDYLARRQQGSADAVKLHKRLRQVIETQKSHVAASQTLWDAVRLCQIASSSLKLRTREDELAAAYLVEIFEVLHDQANSTGTKTAPKKSRGTK